MTLIQPQHPEDVITEFFSTMYRNQKDDPRKGSLVTKLPISQFSLFEEEPIAAPTLITPTSDNDMPDRGIMFDGSGSVAAYYTADIATELVVSSQLLALTQRIDDLEKKLLEYCKQDTKLTQPPECKIVDYQLSSISLVADPEPEARIQTAKPTRTITREECDKIVRDLCHAQ